MPRVGGASSTPQRPRETRRLGIPDHPLSRMMTAATGNVMDKTTPHPLFKLATELGPLIVFFMANAKFNLFVATGAFMVAIVAAMIVSYPVTRHVPIMALVTCAIVILFGTLTLVRHDETFINVKPTIIYALFAPSPALAFLSAPSFLPS